MRKRFWKKQWIAVALASSMAVTAVNVPINQGIFVQASENENTAESGKIFYPGGVTRKLQQTSWNLLKKTGERINQLLLMMKAYKKI